MNVLLEPHNSSLRCEKGLTQSGALLLSHIIRFKVCIRALIIILSSLYAQRNSDIVMSIHRNVGTSNVCIQIFDQNMVVTKCFRENLQQKRDILKTCDQNHKTTKVQKLFYKLLNINIISKLFVCLSKKNYCKSIQFQKRTNTLHFWKNSKHFEKGPIFFLVKWENEYQSHACALSTELVS